MWKHLIIATLIPFLSLGAALSVCVILYRALKRRARELIAKLRNRPSIASLVLWMARLAVKRVVAQVMPRPSSKSAIAQR